MYANVSLRPKFAFQCSLYLFGNLVSIFKSHCAIHPYMNLYGYVVAYVASAQVVGRTHSVV